MPLEPILLVVTVVFFVFVAFKVRPALSSRREKAHALVEPDPNLPAEERARLLLEAAEALTRGVGKVSLARALARRAIAIDPSEKTLETIHRLFERRRRVLDDLLWQFLAVSPWTEPRLTACRSALLLLAKRERGDLGRALHHAWQALARAGGARTPSAVRDGSGDKESP